MEKTKSDKVALGCMRVFGIFVMLMCICVFYFVEKQENQLNKATEECRKLGGYIETFYKNADIICWDKKGTSIYFRQ